MIFKNNSAKSNQWYKLDNAAKIFPGQNTSKWSNIFRVSVVLREQVDPELLEVALKQTLVRFPCFDVRMRRGFFWYYLEKNPHDAPPVMEDVRNPCVRVKWNENRRFLFRVYYHNKRISVEFYHVLSDAYGATCFISTMTACYLRLCGETIPEGGMVLNLNEKASKPELEDSFIRFASSKAAAPRGKSFVYHYVGTKMPAHTMNVTTGFMPSSQVKEKAKEYGATITEFLGALLLFSLYKKQLEEKRKLKDVSLQIPVNLRNAFPSTTLRNFSLCYSARINPNMGKYTFEEILKQLSLYLRYVNNEKELNAMMTANLKLESNPIMRLMPLFVKNWGIGAAFLLTGEQTTSALLSNLGVVKLPKEMEEHVEKMILMTGPGKLNGARTALVTYKDTLAISFANIYKESDIERDFFVSLVKMGIEVKIESNR